MANAKIGSQTSWNQNYVETITTTKQLERGDSGKVFMIDNTVAHTINLPKLSSEIAGWNCKMIVSVNGAADVSVVGYGLPAAGGTTSDNDLVHYREIPLADEAGAVNLNQDGFTIAAATIITDSFEIFSDGTSWFVEALVHEIAHSAPIDS